MSARTCSGATSPLTNLDVSGAGISRFLVGGPGWSGAGPAAVGTGVLPLSVDDPGAKVTCGSRALATADKGNDPSQNGKGLSQVWVPGRPVHRLAPYGLDREAAQRCVSRTSRSSSVPGVSKE